MKQDPKRRYGITDTTLYHGIPQVREGDPNCKHEWIYDDMVYTTNPPIIYRICKFCGRVEAYQEPLDTSPTFWDYYNETGI